MTPEEHAVIAKKILTKLSKELGFVTTGALLESAQKKQLHTIDDVCFVHFHHRKNGQTTIYEIGVLPDFQGQGYGRKLIFHVRASCIARKQKTIFAKCPEGLPSNDFYKHLGFKLIRVEPGKKRRLNCWEKKV